jgi:hypothetical protein
LHHRGVDGVFIEGVEIVLLVQRILLHIGEDVNRPSGSASGAATAPLGYTPWRQAIEIVVVIMQSNADLLEIVTATHAIGGLSYSLDGWKQKCHQQAYNSNHHKQLDERKSAKGIVPNSAPHT